MAAHREDRPRPARPLLVAVVGSPSQAVRALAEGADLVDATAATARERAEISARLPATALWAGSPADPVDADLLARRAGHPGPAAIVTAAAISTWLGAAAIRTRHVRAVRRAIDMTAAIAGTQPPARTIRGLA